MNYLTKAGVKFMSENDKRLAPGVARTEPGSGGKPGSGGMGSNVPPSILKPKPKPKPSSIQKFDPAKHIPR